MAIATTGRCIFGRSVSKKLEHIDESAFMETVRHFGIICDTRRDGM
jgi:hypothetical protein